MNIIGKENYVFFLNYFQLYHSNEIEHKRHNLVWKILKRSPSVCVVYNTIWSNIIDAKISKYDGIKLIKDKLFFLNYLFRG